MINIDCLKSVLEKEDFENKGNKYKHVFEDGKKIEVDFSKMAFRKRGKER